MPYPSKGKTAFQRDKTLDQKDYSMAAMAALKAAVETAGYELELAKAVTGTYTGKSPEDRVLELTDIYFEMLLNKVPGDVPATFPGSTPVEATRTTTIPAPTSSGSGGDLLIDFGKFRDSPKTIAQIDDEDPGYVRWLADKANQAEVKNAARSYLDAKYAKAEEEDPYAA